MGKDFDWKETDRLVEQLRAKLAEDPDFLNESEKDVDLTALAPTSEAPVQVQEKSKRTRAPKATAVRKKVPVAEKPATVAPMVEQAEEPVCPTPVAEPTAQSAPTVSIFEEEHEPSAVPQGLTEEPASTLTEEAPIPEEAGESSVQTESTRVRRPARSYRAGMAPLPTNRSNLFASASRREGAEGKDRPTFVAKKAGARNVTPPPQLQKEDEMRAEETVEHLLEDLFGANSEWLTERNVSVSEEVTLLESEAATQVPERIETVAPDPIEKETAVVVEEPAKGLPLEEASENFETITRDQDGQMALVLPETGRPLAIPAEEKTSHRKSLEQKLDLSDDGQIDLFSMLSMEQKGSAGSDIAVGENAESEQERVAFKRSMESSDEDFHLLMELDYENELGNAIGFEKIRDYHEIGVNGQEVVKRRRRKATDKREFETQGQDTVLRKIYTKQKREHVLRLCISLALTLLIFLYEGTNAFAAMFGGPFDGEAYPVSYIFIGIQLLVIAAFFSWQRLLTGFVRLIRFSPIDYSLCSVMLIVTLIYHVVLACMPHTGEPTLYLSPAAMSLVLLALADLLDWYRESLAFQVVSSRKQKYALIPRVSVGGKEGDARSRLEEGAGEKTVWYIRPVGFVRNYFANTKKRVAHSRTLGAQLLLIAAIGFSVGLYVLAAGGTAGDMLQSVFVTFLLCTPTTLLLITSLPMFLAACLRLGKRSAIVGEDPIYQCTRPTTLVMPDSETFASMHHERFELIEDCNITRVTVLVRALLEKLQSPLCESVSVERDLRMSPNDLTLTEIDEHGVSATTNDGKTNIMMGNMTYMQRYGIRVQPRAGGDYEDIYRRLICVAVDQKVSALFLARYRLNDSMIDLLTELEEADVQVMVRTKDPGVSNALFERLLPDRKTPVLVMKPTANEMDLRTDRVDATIVALGSCKEAARTFVTCRRIRRAGRFGKIFQVLSVGTGALIAGLFALLRRSVVMSSILVSLYLLFWCAVHAVTSYFYLREKKDD